MSKSNSHHHSRNDIAKSFYQDFNKLISNLSKKYMHDIDWWVSEIASRNTYVCPLFSDIVNYFFQIQDNKSIKPLKKKSKLFKRTIRYGGLCCLLLYRWLIAKIQPNRNRKFNQPITLIDIFILKDSFNQSHSYQDRYYGKMLNYLSIEERKNFYYAPTLLDPFQQTWNTFKHLRQSPQQFLLKEDYLKLRDYLWAMLYPIRAFKFFPKKIFFQDKDITTIMRHAFWSTLFSSGSIEGLLKYRFAKRLKEKKIQIRLVIDWFENQSVDKGANMGFRKFYPDTPITGYQAFFVPELYLCMFPTQAEYEANVLPHQMSVCGSKLVASRKIFCPELTVKVAPAFRFSDIYSSRSLSKSDDSYKVLIILPISFQLSIDILKLIHKLPSIDSSIRFHIKPHPATSKKNYHYYQDKFNFSIVNTTNIVTAIDNANLVIGQTSSACLCAISRATPVIIIESKLALSQNPIPSTISKEIWGIAHDLTELKQLISDFFSSRENNNFTAISESIKSEYFEPVSNKGVRNLLQL